MRCSSSKVLDTSNITHEMPKLMSIAQRRPTERCTLTVDKHITPFVRRKKTDKETQHHNRLTQTDEERHADTDADTVMYLY